MLCNTKDLLAGAQRGKYAVAAFNVYNLETVQAAFHVADREQKPVILALGERYFSIVDVEAFAAMVHAMAKKSTVPVALHLDHAYDRRSITRAIDNGFTSVMYDGSKYALQENIRRTMEVVDLAHRAGVSVEAEIDSVMKGAFSDEEEGSGLLTDPKSARIFVDATGVDFLAAAIGTVHGMYQGDPNIDLALLERIRQEVDVPLVLHGGSGTPHEIIRQAIARGICKINVNTEISLAGVARLRHDFNTQPTTSHLSTLMADMQKSVEEAMTKFVRLFSDV